MVANGTRQIWETKTAAKAEWEADKCRKHQGNMLTGNAGSKRPIPMNIVKPLAAGFYQLQSGYKPVGRYLKQFGHRADDKFWWCGGEPRMVTQIQEHLFHQYSRWRGQQIPH